MSPGRKTYINQSPLFKETIQTGNTPGKSDNQNPAAMPQKAAGKHTDSASQYHCCQQCALYCMPYSVRTVASTAAQRMSHEGASV